MIDPNAIDSDCCRSSLDKKKVYTSKFNELFLSNDVPKNITVFDTTLRDGEQTPGVALTCDDKIRIAKALDELGVNVIEVGFPASSQGEKDAAKAIMNLGLNSKVCGLARSVKSDIDAVADCGLNYVHTFIATSDSHLRYKLKMTQDEVLERAVSAVEYAKSRGLEVEFSCEDATRTSLEFLKKMHIAVQEAGVNRINVPDTVGTISPIAMEYLIRELKTVTKVPISVHCHDDFGMAVANTLSAVRGGAEQIHATINGMGERAGNASLEEAVLALMAFYNAETTINTKMIGPTCKLVSRLFGYPIPANKAIVGKNAFAHESGIHSDGIIKNAATYESITPELVGRKRRFVIGKHMGTHGLDVRLKELGVNVSKNQLKKICDNIKVLADKGKTVTDVDLQAIADNVLEINHKDRIKLNEVTIVSGNKVMPTASVKLTVDGEEVLNAGVGIGPVDAAINAVNSLDIFDDIDFIEYHVDAITGGTDALIDVIIKLQKGDKIISARGTEPDIINASVKAYISGVNRLLSN